MIEHEFMRLRLKVLEKEYLQLKIENEFLKAEINHLINDLKFIKHER